MRAEPDGLRWRHERMQTLNGPKLSLLLVASMILAACSSLGFPDTGSGRGGGNAVPPAPGGPGVVGPAPGGPGNAGGGDPGVGIKPSLETPTPGQLNPQPVNVWKMEPSIDGRHLTVLLSWWGGVAPCSVLDSVVVGRDGTTISMTPREGADPRGQNQVCPAIAMLRATIVDLGILAPGPWTLAVSGDLAPLTITIR